MKIFMRAFLMLAIIFLLTGCRQGQMAAPRGGKEAQKQDRKPAEGLELVNAIYRPEPYQLSIKRDPFSPFFDKSFLSGMGAELFDLRDSEIRVHGILMKEADAIALLETPAGVIFVREGGKVGGYTVISIGLETVIIEDENKTETLKLGGEDEKR